MYVSLSDHWGGIVAYSSFLHCFSSLRFVDICLCNSACLFFPFSVILLWICIFISNWDLCPVSHLISDKCYLFMVDSLTVRSTSTMAAKRAQIIIAPCLTVSMRCWYPVWDFVQTYCCTLLPNISTLILSVQRSLFQKSYVLFSCIFASLSCTGMFFLERRGFWPLQTNQSRSNCTVLTFNLQHANWGL